MTFISIAKLAVQRWLGRAAREILPRLFLNSITLAIRQLPGMAMFSPMMLSIVIAIAFHTVVGTATGLETSIVKLTAKGLWPALLGAFAFFLIAGFSLTLIELMG